MGRVVHLEDNDKFVIHRFPDKADEIQRAIDIIARLDINSCSGASLLWEAQLILVNARDLVKLSRSSR